MNTNIYKIKDNLSMQELITLFEDRSYYTKVKFEIEENEIVLKIKGKYGFTKEKNVKIKVISDKESTVIVVTEYKKKEIIEKVFVSLFFGLFGFVAGIIINYNNIKLAIQAAIIFFILGIITSIAQFLFFTNSVANANIIINNKVK